MRSSFGVGITCLAYFAVATLFYQPASGAAEAPPPTVTDVEQQAQQAMKKSQYDKAAHLFGQAAEMLEAADKKDVRLFRDLISQTHAFTAEANYGAAQAPSQHAMDVLKALPSATPDLMANAYETLASVSEGLGNYDDDIANANQALAIIEKQYGSTSALLIPPLITLTRAYATKAQYAQGEHLALRVINLLGPKDESAQTAEILRVQGEMYVEQNKFEQAEPVLKRTLGLDEKHNDNFSAATTLDRLSGLYMGQKRTTDAENVLKKAITVAKKGDKPTVMKDRQVVWFLVKLAGIYNVEGKHDDAETQLTIAQDLAKTAFAPNHFVNAVILNGLASTYIQEGKYAEAEKFYRQVLSFSEETAPQNKQPKKGPFQLGLAAEETVQVKTPIKQEDTGVLSEALALSRKSLGANHPIVSSALSNLGQVCLLEGKTAEAESYFQQALNIRKASLGMNHPNTAYSLESLGSAYAKQKDFAKAEPLYEQALAIFKNLEGNHAADIVNCLINIGSLQSEAGNQAKAEQVLNEALDRCNQATTTQAAKVDADSMLEQASQAVALGQVQEEPLMATALSLHADKSLGPATPLAANVLLPLGRVLSKESKFKDAEAACRRALQIRQRYTPDTALAGQAMVALSTVLADEKQFEEAQSLLDQASAIAQKNAGDRSLPYAKVLRKMAKLKSLQGKDDESKQLDEQASAIEDAQSKSNN